MGKRIWVLAGITALMVVRNIWAEEEEIAKFDLGEVVVTATRTAREMSSVSSRVSIINEEDIKSSNAKNVPDLLKSLEGIHVYDSSGVGTAGRINMRGFWGGMSTHNLVLIDGIPVNKGKDKLAEWNLIPLDNIERIEVVRGPSSALYGDNAFAGVINIITKEGRLIPETKVSSSLGSFNTRNHRITTGGGGKERMNYLFNVSRKLTDGYREHNDYRDIHLGGNLGLFIDDASEIKFSLGYHESQRGAYPWVLTETQMAEDRNQARPGTEDDEGEDTKADFGITYRRDLDEISSLMSTFYLRDEESESYYTGTSSKTSTKEQLEDESTCGLLFQYNFIQNLLELKNLFTVGIDLEQNDFDYREYSAPYQVRGDLRKDYEALRYKWGVYVQDEMDIGKSWQLILGLRHDEIDFDFDDYLDDSKSKEKSMSATSPKFGLVYNYRGNGSIYVSIARAFRTPTLGQMFTYGSYANLDLEPEEADSYELGIKQQFADLMVANISLYQMDLDNEIWYDAAEKKYRNYGETSHKGVETSVDINIVKWLRGYLTYTYTRAKNESGADAGRYLTYVPEHMGSFGLRYKSETGLAANIAVNRIGSSYLDSANTEKLSPYTTVDARISYERRWYSVFLAVDNLFDEEYSYYGYKTSSGTKKFNPAPGRTLTMGIEVKF
ncbi:TonB-dependent receptor [bacterium]|nr:TonB-dependent receptor [bacterium]